METKTQHLRFAGLFVVVLTMTGLTAFGSQRWETLQAINLVENPRNSTRVGPRGELGPYQFRVSTWRMYTRRPFAQAVQRDAADEVAVKHYEWIKRGLESGGIEPTVFNIALAWNAGLDTVLNGRAPNSAYTYAAQVNNLVAQLDRNLASAQ